MSTTSLPFASFVRPLVAVLALGSLGACESPDALGHAAHGESHASTERVDSGSYYEQIVLAVANDASFDELDVAAGLDRRAATNIVAHRAGADGVDGSSDDDLFDDIEEVDAVSYVGPAALDQLLAYAIAIYGEEPVVAVIVNGVEEGSVEGEAVLYLANTLSVDALDDDAALDSRAAANIVAHRAGADGVDGTADDAPFATLTELDAVSYVALTAFDHLVDYADFLGLFDGDADGDGYTWPDDCNEADDTVNPGATELCNGVDDDCDATTGDDGVVSSSAGSAYTTIADALSGAAAGETITVCPGTYTETLTVDRTVDLVSFGGPDVTTIDGDGMGSVLRITGADVLVEGFTLTGGAATSATYERGGGVYQDASGGGLVLRDVVVEGNTALRGGGMAANAEILLDGVEVVNNTATGHSSYGGGIWSWSSSFTAVDTRISGNSAGDGGGGVYVNSPSNVLTLERVEVSDNTATTGGGAYDQGLLDATDTTFSENTATTGAAIFTGNGAAVVSLTDSEVMSNTASDAASGAVHMQYGTIASSHTDWGQGATENRPADFVLEGVISRGSLDDDESFTCAYTSTSTGGSCTF